MISNDVLRRVRYILDFNDAKMLDVFAQADYPATTEQLHSWLRKEDDPAFVEITDIQMSLFLNGLINLKRGKREGVEAPVERRLTNNIIFMKLKIAFNMQAEAILETMEVSGFKISKHELSALFRKPENRQYRLCKDQILRNFLTGLQKQMRGE
ncbi:DUF1456 family protein [Paraglaciecola sp. L3A3]|uniref:DUF1456 family protein n=1 Tax=Paraglaciecola sp. L3A3 TaxID=2686358 RepID=UPI00131E2188|nr:DUF1456 family protein [Paraglaciecola sp. L3A3]